MKKWDKTPSELMIEAFKEDDKRHKEEKIERALGTIVKCCGDLQKIYQKN